MAKTKVKNTEPKRERARLAKAELWLNLAQSAQGWADSITKADAVSKKIAAGGKQERNDVPPIERWPNDYPICVLMKLYDLEPKDMARLCTQIANEVENRALKAGYEDRWDGEDG